MAKKLYIGGLSYSTSQETMRDAFAQAGEVLSATIITDKMTGRSRGFGFVEMANDDEADKAIEMFDGKDLDGRVINVSEARPMQERPRGSFQHRDGGFGGGRKGGFSRDRF